MKKRLIIVLLTSTLLLSGCGLFRRKTSNPSDASSSNPTSDTSENPSIPVGGNVTIYLSLGEIGLYEGQKGNDYPDMFLENAIKLDTQVGASLPGKDKITSTSGAEFANWMAYEGTGAPVKYDTAPNENNKILYANWTGGEGSEQSGSEVTPIGDYTYVVTSMPDWIDNDGCVTFAWIWSPSSAGEWVTTNFTSETSLNFGTNEELTGFLLVRCAPNTTTPNWDETGDVPGRIYNKTDDVSCSSGNYTYELPASKWH